MQFAYALTLLVSATLLFFVQPMFAKMALPLLGGTPAVWNTCMVFYQVALLLGYLYAHFSTRWLGVRRQAALHLALMAIPWLVLPIGIAASRLPAGGENPIPWLLGLMTVSVGLPFFLVSTSAPMLQAWFAQTGHASSKDPYYLYAASNLGSMLALLGYPIVVEPHLPLAMQSRAWAIGYGALMALTALCAVLLWRSRVAAPEPAVGEPVVGEPEASVAPTVPAAVPSLLDRGRWLALSFVPSSLLLGVTTFISTDLAAAPLLWTLPLALYLLTFVLVFARRPLVWRPGLLVLQPLAVATVAVIFHENLTGMMWAVALMHLALFFVTTLVCHGELARSRPSARYLTEFYIWMSVGGALGGMFNALVAPVVFPTIVEYPLAIVLACMLRPRLHFGETKWPHWVDPTEPPERSRESNPVLSRWLDLVLPLWLWFLLKELTNWLNADLPWIPASVEGVWTMLATGLVALGFRRWRVRIPLLALVAVAAAYMTFSLFWSDRLREAISASGSLDLVSRAHVESVVLGLGALVSLLFLHRPVRFGLAIGCVLLAGHLWYGADSGVRDDLLHLERSFFGVLRVEEDHARDSHTLTHGSTTHGEQSWDPDAPEKRLDPWTYYHRNGPLGDVMETLIEPRERPDVAVIGLGTGTTAAYAQEGWSIAYFEIDPAVVRIAENREWFTYLTDARQRGAAVEIVLGDARLSLREARFDGRFDLLAVDAFSSDAIPMHLLTREAFALYFEKLKPDGVLMVHVSNRYLELAPVVRNLAEDAGLVARRFDDQNERQEGEYTSEWVAVVRQPQHLGDLLGEMRWEEIPPDPLIDVWTDDFSNLLGALDWYRRARSWFVGQPEP